MMEMQDQSGGLRRRRAAHDDHEHTSAFSSVSNKIKEFDVYTKVHDDFRTNTRTGGAVSILAVITMLLLFLSELKNFMSVEVIDHVVVDTTLPQHIHIDLDMKFPSIQCDDLNISYVEKPNEPQVEMRGNITMEIIDVLGQKPAPVSRDFCGPCLEAKSFMTGVMPCCNTCKELRQAYRNNGLAKKEPALLTSNEMCLSSAGCSVKGTIKVNKVTGNFHFAIGSAYSSGGEAIYEWPDKMELSSNFNSSHDVHMLRFGPEVPGVTFPLESANKRVEQGMRMYHYFLKLVPMKYIYANGEEVLTYQYAVSDISKQVKNSAEGLNGLPGVFIAYELSPFMVEKREKAVPFTHFLASTVAILGGVFSVAVLVNGLLLAAFPAKSNSGALC